MQHRLVDPLFALGDARLGFFCLTAPQFGKHCCNQTVELIVIASPGTTRR